MDQMWRGRVTVLRGCMPGFESNIVVMVVGGGD